MMNGRFHLPIVLHASFIRLRLNGLFLLFILLGGAVHGSLPPLPSLEELSLEQKIGQLLLVHFRGREFNADAEQLIREAHVGGFIYYQWANGLDCPLQIQRLSESLQSACQKEQAIPLLISIDQEGGIVNRIAKGATIFPGNYALGQTDESQWAEDCANAIGKELLALGINMNLSPVVDVNSNPFNPVIGIRSFSSKPEVVAQFGEKALAGFRKAGIIATLKHFPGHGDVKLDSHETLPIVYKSMEELEEIELVPFKALASQAPVIMTAHLMVPALDPDDCVTLSSPIIDGLLRNTMGFQGVIVTDSLVMQGLLEQCSSIEEAALRSLQAGHDLLLLGGKQLFNQSGLELTCDDVLRIHRFLVEAVIQGLLSEEKINESVKRILTLKQNHQFYPFASNMEDVLNFSLDEHQKLAEKIASAAIQILHGTVPIPDSDQNFALVLPEILREEIEHTDWSTIGKKAKLLFFKSLNPTENECDQILKECKTADICVFFSYNSWRYGNQLNLFSRIQDHCPQAIALVVRDPKDALLLSYPDRLLCTFSPTAYSLQAAKDHLTGEGVRHE